MGLEKFQGTWSQYLHQCHTQIQESQPDVFFRMHPVLQVPFWWLSCSWHFHSHLHWSALDLSEGQRSHLLLSHDILLLLVQGALLRFFCIQHVLLLPVWVQFLQHPSQRFHRRQLQLFYLQQSVYHKKNQTLSSGCFLSDIHLQRILRLRFLPGFP